MSAELDEKTLILQSIGETKLEECLAYLDVLRESGVTNMFGAAPYVERSCNLDRKVAKAVLIYWMKTFESRQGGG